MPLGGRQRRRGRLEGGSGQRRRRRHGLALRSGLLGKEKIAGTGNPAVLRRPGVAVLRSTPERHPPITFGSHPHSHEHPSSSHLLLSPPS